MTEATALLAELDARRQIHDVLQTLSRGIDRNDRATILSCYHPGAYDDHGEFKGSPEGFADYVDEIHKNRYVCTVHFLGNQRVVVDGDTATSETYVLGVLRFKKDGELFDFNGFGRYLDRWEKRSNEWRIVERITLLDSDRIDRVAMRAQGPLTETLQWGTASRDDPSYKLWP